jgi:hypothetical protein
VATSSAATRCRNDEGPRVYPGRRPRGNGNACPQATAAAARTDPMSVRVVSEQAWFCRHSTPSGAFHSIQLKQHHPSVVGPPGKSEHTTSGRNLRYCNHRARLPLRHLPLRLYHLKLAVILRAFGHPCNISLEPPRGCRKGHHPLDLRGCSARAQRG